VAQNVLFFFGQLGHPAPGGSVRDEDRVEAKALRSFRLGGNYSVAHSIEIMRLAVNYQGQRTFEGGAPIGAVLHFMQQLGDTAGEIVATIAGGVQSGGAPKAINFQTRIIRDTIDAISFPYIFCLLESILVIRTACFRNIHLVRHRPDCQADTKLLRQSVTYILNLTYLTGVTCCKNQFHNLQIYLFFRIFASVGKTDNIIILNKTPFGEKSAVIHCLSAGRGRCALMVHSASRNAGFLQPLSVLECSVSENAKSSLAVASAFCDLYPLRGIRSCAGKNAISMFIAEVLFRALKEGFSDTGLFEWCIREILLLDSLESDYSNFHIRFLLDFISALGYSPSYEDLLPFLDAEGPTGAQSLAEAVKPVMDLPLAKSMLVPLSGSQRSAICSRLLRYLEFHLEYPIRIRSLGVLSELF